LQSQHDDHVGLGPVEETARPVVTGPMERELLGEECRTVRTLPNGQGRLVRYQVVLRDDRYAYVAKLEGLEGPDIEDLRIDFLDTIATIEAIPLPLEARGARGTRNEPIFMWSD